MWYSEKKAERTKNVPLPCMELGKIKIKWKEVVGKCGTKFPNFASRTSRTEEAETLSLRVPLYFPEMMYVMKNLGHLL